MLKMINQKKSRKDEEESGVSHTNKKYSSFPSFQT
jgi:hypothetical protein